MSPITMLTPTSKNNPTIARVQNNFKLAAGKLGKTWQDLNSELDENNPGKGSAQVTANGHTIRFTRNTGDMWLAHCPDLVKAGCKRYRVYHRPKQIVTMPPTTASLHKPGLAGSTSFASQQVLNAFAGGSTPTTTAKAYSSGETIARVTDRFTKQQIVDIKAAGRVIVTGKVFATSVRSGQREEGTPSTVSEGMITVNGRNFEAMDADGEEPIVVKKA